MLGCIAFRLVFCSLLPPVGVERAEQMVAGMERGKGKPVKKGQRNAVMGAGGRGGKVCLSHHSSAFPFLFAGLRLIFHPPEPQGGPLVLTKVSSKARKHFTPEP